MRQDLSSRERQCLYLAGQDKTLFETAAELKISTETVKTYRRIVLQKMNCRTMAGALFQAMNHGLLG